MMHKYKGAERTYKHGIDTFLQKAKKYSLLVAAKTAKGSKGEVNYDTLKNPKPKRSLHRTPCNLLSHFVMLTQLMMLM